jgi:phenylacetate-CoA ligase
MSGPADLQRRFYDMLMASQYWPADRMQQHQRTQLAQLLRHAKANVPFYEHRLDVVFRPDGDIDWDRWNEIPVVTRGDLQEHRETMQARELPAGHGEVRVSRSSGSTGEPVATSRNELARVADSAARQRAMQWHQLDFDRVFVDLSGDDPQVGVWPEGSFRGPWGPPWSHGKGGRFVLNLHTTPANAAQFLDDLHAAYLSGLPSRLEPIAVAARDLGIEMRLELILSRGEAVTERQRGLFAAVFGARTVELYAATEAFTLAQTCPDCGRYHVNAELGLVELLDDAGGPALAGQLARIVVTSFYNTAQPLIRYELGDRVRVGAPGACRPALPVIDQVAGRAYQMFRLPNGREFVPVVPAEISLRPDIQRWQLAQVGADAIEFRYATGPDASILASEIETILRAALPSSFNLRLAALDTRQPLAGGKHLLFINEITARQ